jgi:hypothetical protein
VRRILRRFLANRAKLICPIDDIKVAKVTAITSLENNH